MLGGALKKASESTRRGFKEKVERFRPNLEAYEALCESLGEKPADTSRPLGCFTIRSATAPIVGPRVVDQLTASLHALEIELPQETLDQLGQDLAGSRRRSARCVRVVATSSPNRIRRAGRLSVPAELDQKMERRTGVVPLIINCDGAVPD